MNRCIIFTLAFAFFFCFHAKAQESKDNFWTPHMKEIAEESSGEGWIKFKPGANINPLTIFEDYKTAFRLSADDEMRLVSTEKDHLGFTSYQYRQYYRGIKISGGGYRLHVNKEGITYSAHGKLLTGLREDVSPIFSESSALQIALSHVNAPPYLWEDPEEEKRLKERTGDSNATHYPKGELVFVKKPGVKEFAIANFEFTWQFDIYDKAMVKAQTVFVDAKNGRVVNTLLLVYSCDNGTGTTTWYGSGKDLHTAKNLLSEYYLKDDCAGEPLVHTFNYNNGANDEYWDPNNTWTSSDDQSGVTTHWCIHKTLDYYNARHGRKSWNPDPNDPYWIDIYNNYDDFIDPNGNPYGANASWSSIGNTGKMKVGNNDTPNDPADDWNTLDIIGHEFTHGVTQTEAGLVYQDESGALNESFSDIFGEMVEDYGLGSGTPNDWLVGADRGVIRSLIDPNDEDQPDTYEGDLWCDYSNGSLWCTQNDDGGVHTNSGVQNHWFYLLVEGGSGWNDGTTAHAPAGNGYAWSVSGIGRDDARDIAYRNLTAKLNSSDNYLDARAGSIESAVDLFGSCANQTLQTANAWHAVGVGPESSKYNRQVCGTLTTGTYKGISTVEGGGGCTTTIPSGNVEFAAPDGVKLKAGFRAVAGCTFKASINACARTTY